MPSNDQLNERWFQLLYGGFVIIVGWLCYRSITHDAQMQAIQFQISNLIQVQSNVIPPVVEASLKELRDKTNVDRELISRLSESVNANTREISYVRELIKPNQ